MSWSDSVAAPKASTRSRATRQLHRCRCTLCSPSAFLSDPPFPLQVPLLLALGRRSLKLPSRWLARGLGRECWSHSEMSFWQRYWGQQAISVPLLLRPLRAPQAVLRPSREAANARMLRFGGPIKPWLRRCSSSAPASLCGRPPLDCAKLWWRHVDPALVRLIQAGSDAVGLRLPVKALPRPCVPRERPSSLLTCLPEGVPPEPTANVTVGALWSRQSTRSW